MNIKQAIATTHRQAIYSKTQKNADGSPYNVRVNGKCKTWKSEPDRFLLPVKRGLKIYGYISNDNAENWVTA